MGDHPELVVAHCLHGAVVLGERSRTAERTLKRRLTTTTDLPQPQLMFAFEARVDVAAEVSIGSSGADALLFFPITGGTVSGPKLNGTVGLRTPYSSAWPAPSAGRCASGSSSSHDGAGAPG